MRRTLASYPEVRQVLSQTGRPNDGTDATGFYNIEFHVDIYPEKQWESKLTKAELIEKMQDRLAIYPGVDFNFSQPISDNVEEAASGVKGSIAVKVFGKDLYESEKKAVEVYKVLQTVDRIEDLGVIRNIGQPELRIELNESRLAALRCGKEDVQSISKWRSGGRALPCFTKTNGSSISWYAMNPRFRRSEDEDRQDTGSCTRRGDDPGQGTGGYPHDYGTVDYRTAIIMPASVPSSFPSADGIWGRLLPKRSRR